MPFRLLSARLLESLRAMPLILVLVMTPAVSRAGIGGGAVLASEYAGATVLTLDEVVALAVRQHRGIQAAYLQRVAEKFDLYVAEGKFHPKLIVGGNVLRNRYGADQTTAKEATVAGSLLLPTGASMSVAGSRGLGGSTGSAYSTTVMLEQPLLKNAGPQANSASVTVARLNDRIGYLGRKSLIAQSVTQVIHAYRELLRAQEQKKIAQAALQRGRELHAINETLIASGRMAEIERFQTEADVAGLEFSLAEADNQVDAARLALLSLLAMESTVPIAAQLSGETGPMGVDTLKFLEIALTHQPDYQASLLELEKAQVSLEYARNQQQWDLSLVAGKTQARGISPTSSTGEIPSTGGEKYSNSYTGLQLKIPLGDRTIEQMLVHAAVDVETLELRLAEARQILEQRIRDAARNIQTRWRQVELARKASSFSILKLDAEREKLQAGRSSNFQVLSFENDLRNAENTRVNAEIAYLNALSDLDERLGKVLDTWNIPLVEPASAAHAHGH